MTRNGRAVTIIAVLLMAGLFWLVQSRYHHDLEEARERLATGSQVVQTPCGPIEYASVGTGPAILVVHGAGGGYDQGLMLTKPLVTNGIRVIAMSRFGYLRTPLPPDASASAQAEAHTCLLDALGIGSTAVIGISAGGPSAMQFALRHPHRCKKMVLLVPAAYVPRPGNEPSLKSPAATAWLFDTVLQSDFLFWAAIRIMRPVVIRAILATPPSVVEKASHDEQERVSDVLAHILPVSPRRLGLLNDAAVTSTLPRYDLESIETPSLLISAVDDLFGTFDGARYTTEHLPQARFIGYREGGHMLVGHHQEVMAEIAAFVR